MSVSRVVCGICLQISCVAPCPRSWVALSLSTMGRLRHCARQESPHPSSQLACRQSIRHSSCSHSRCPLRRFSDPFHHVCQLYADDLVILTASRADLQVALDAVHAWGVRWRFSFGVGPTKSATMVFELLRGCPDCCVHLGGVPLPLVQQVQVSGCCSLSHVDFVCSRGDRLFHQASAWCLGEGLPLSSSSFRQKREGSDSHIRALKEQFRRHIPIPERNPDRQRKRKEDLQMHHRTTKVVQSGMKSKKSLQGIDHTNFTRSSSRRKDSTRMSTKRTSEVTSLQSRRIPRQAWRYIPKERCTQSTVAVRYT